MNITIGWWAIPTLITVALGTLGWDKGGGSSNWCVSGLGNVIEALFRLILTLVVWLIYFAIMYFIK
jgi:hypothetical protein